jgi:GT2 family glycosyltransferase
VIFTRDDADHLRRCLATLIASPPIAGFEVIVFDNASRDDTAAVVADAALQLDECRLLRTETETSFSDGNNRGLAEARGRYVLFLNPDTEPSGAILDAVLEAVHHDAAIGLVSPRLEYRNGDPQPTGWRLPTPVALAQERLRLKTRHIEGSGAEVTDVGWLMGCFLLGPTDFIRELGGFDEAFWFHGTDLEICARVRKAGRRVVRLESASMVHVGHREWDDDRKKKSHAALVQYLRRDHGVAAALGAITAAAERLRR